MEEQNNQPVIQQPEPQMRSSSGMPRMVIIAGVVVLMALIGVGGYVLGTRNGHNSQINQPISSITKSMPTVAQASSTVLPTSSVPSDWKTYKNSTYGLSVNYPSSWQVSEIIPVIPMNKVGDSAPLFYFAPPGFPTPGIGLDGIVDFFVHKTDGTMTAMDWAKKNGYRAGSLSDSAYQALTINGNEAARMTFVQTQELYNKQLSGAHGGPMPVGYKATFTYVKKGNLMFEIQAGKISNPDEFINTASQIITTLSL